MMSTRSADAIFIADSSKAEAAVYATAQQLGGKVVHVWSETGGLRIFKVQPSAKYNADDHVSWAFEEFGFTGFAKDSRGWHRLTAADKKAGETDTRPVHMGEVTVGLKPSGLEFLRKAMKEPTMRGAKGNAGRPGWVDRGGGKFTRSYGPVLMLAQQTADGWRGQLFHGLSESGAPRKVGKPVKAKNALALEGNLADQADRYMARVEESWKGLPGGAKVRKAMKRARGNGEWQSLGRDRFAVSYGQGLHAIAEKYADTRHPHKPWHGQLVRGAREVHVSKTVHATTAAKLELELEQLAQSWLLAHGRRGRAR
jgi:hypothetical protein